MSPALTAKGTRRLKIMPGCGALSIGAPASSQSSQAVNARPTLPGEISSTVSPAETLLRCTKVARPLAAS